MVGKPINLSYLVVGLHGLKIFEIRFGEKVHIVQGPNVKIEEGMNFICTFPPPLEGRA